jgi:hypothetical protein
LKWEEFEPQFRDIQGLDSLSAEERRAVIAKEVLWSANVPPSREFAVTKEQLFKSVRSPLEAIFEFMPISFLLSEVCAVARVLSRAPVSECACRFCPPPITTWS